MKIINTKPIKYCVMAFLSLSIVAAAPREFGEEKAFFHGYLIPTPVIKVGLGVNLSDIKIGSSSGMKVYEVNSNYRLLGDDEDEVFVKGSKEKLTEKFLIQVARTKDRQEAERVALALGAKIENRVYVAEDTENEVFKNFQVNIGDFLTRSDALSFIRKLKQIGITDTWILRQEITEEESKPLWILINNELKNLSEDTDLYFIPSSQQSYLSFNGRDYRGIFVLLTTNRGMVLVNILNVEDYLKSVVPSELSPYTYGELEALKAQAVAARTYALRHLGMNRELGFDLCDSPKSQFYQGIGAEHPLSSKAVELTKGEAALYRGRLINALYTSTCGGMTEDVENIFEGPSLPYLKSTKCVHEKRNEWLLRSKNLINPVLVNGRNISADIAYLIGLKVIPFEIDADFYQKQASLEEATDWIKNSVALLGKKNEGFNPEQAPLNLMSFGRLIIEAFEWDNRVENLLLDSESSYIMKGSPNLPSKDRDHLAYLIQEGIFPSGEEAESFERALTRAEVVSYLGKTIDSYRDLRQQGMFYALSGNMIEIEEEEGKRRYPLSPEIFLLRNNSGYSSFASQIELLGGEEVRFIETDGKVQFLEVIYPPHSNTLDRNSSSHSWQIRISREALEKKINQYHPVGKLVDIVPLKRGKSKRVLEISVKGEESQVVVKGLRIRSVFGLRETFFVIDKEYDGQGRITYFNFLGRGLGHGVGLCQVGAYGMALAGSKYKDILKKYYRGIKINKIY